MATIQHSHRSTGPRRRIGPIGTTARVIVGGLLLGNVVQGHLARPFRPAAWALGLLGFPALLLGWQLLRARRTPTRLQATGPVANVLNVVLFLALYLTNPGLCACPVGDQRRRPPLLRRVDAAGRAARIRRLRGAGRLQLAAWP